jgi:Major intrinsic protein
MGAFIAEFIGTFALMFIGGGAIINGQASLVGVALAHGLTIAAFGSAFGAVSGGHFNPAVTIAMLVTGRIEVPKAVGYILVQCLGAIVAAFLLTVTFPADQVAAVKLGTPLLAGNISIGGAIIAEAVTTFALVSVIMGTAVDAHERAPDRLDGHLGHPVHRTAHGRGDEPGAQHRTCPRQRQPREFLGVLDRTDSGRCGSGGAVRRGDAQARIVIPFQLSLVCSKKRGLVQARGERAQPVTLARGRDTVFSEAK